MSRKETLEDLMERPLYEHVRVVPPLLESAVGAQAANEYERRVSASDSGGYPDIGFLNTIRYAKKYLKEELDARESEGHYLALIVMDDWEKNRSHPEDSNAAFDGPMSENAYPEGNVMNDVARRYNKAHGYIDKAADIPWTPESAQPDGKGGESISGPDLGESDPPAVQPTLEWLMGTNPLEILRIVPSMLEAKEDDDQGSTLVEEYFEKAQAGNYEDLRLLTVRYASDYLSEELEVEEDEDYYLRLSN